MIRRRILAMLGVDGSKKRGRSAKQSRKRSRNVLHSFIGRDMAHASHSAAQLSRHLLPAGLIGVFFATLALTVLREELIEVGYEVVAAVDEEARLREERDRWIARVQELRNPARLSALAHKNGFSRPKRTIDLRALRDRSAVADLYAEIRPSRGASR